MLLTAGPTLKPTLTQPSKLTYGQTVCLGHIKVKKLH